MIELRIMFKNGYIEKSELDKSNEQAIIGMIDNVTANSSNWQTIIANNGKFSFKGDDVSFISYTICRK